MSRLLPPICIAGFLSGYSMKTCICPYDYFFKRRKYRLPRNPPHERSLECLPDTHLTPNDLERHPIDLFNCCSKHLLYMPRSKTEYRTQSEQRKGSSKKAMHIVQDPLDPLVCSLQVDEDVDRSDENFCKNQNNNNPLEQFTLYLVVSRVSQNTWRMTKKVQLTCVTVNWSGCILILGE